MLAYIIPQFHFAFYQYPCTTVIAGLGV